MSGRVYIGTSGWSYDDWKETLYPEDTPSKDFLRIYSDTFSTVEINNSFYRLPSTEAVKSWNKSTPKDFVFSVKASRYITHNKKLNDPGKTLKTFFEAVRPLREKTGPILFQLPPSWRVNTERLENFLKTITRRKNRYVFEFRHKSWECDEVYSLLADYNAAWCIYDLAGYKSPEVLTADFVYLRLHGPKKAYQGSYDKRTLAAYARKFRSWTEQNKDVYCYFDNDQKGCAPVDAKNLLAHFGKK